MAKPTVPTDGNIRHRVWQPQGYGGVEIGIKQGTSELHFPKFFLQNYTVVLNGKGHGSARYGRKRYRFSQIENLVFLQQPDRVFSGEFAGERGTGGICIAIPPRRLEEMTGDLEIEGALSFDEMILPSRENVVVAQFAARSIGSFLRPSSRLERESTLLELINALITHTSAANHSSRQPGHEHRAISTVKALIQENPGEDYSISALARITRLNPKYLIDVFTRDVGVSPHLYLTSVRIDQAKTRLAKGEAIGKVAYELGFYDQSHFSRTFKRHVRVSPGAFKTYSREII